MLSGLYVTLNVSRTRLRFRDIEHISAKNNSASLFINDFVVCILADLNPMPTQEIVTSFNELRQDIVLMNELKMALANCEYELQTLRHRFETLTPGRVRRFSPEFFVLLF